MFYEASTNGWLTKQIFVDKENIIKENSLTKIYLYKIILIYMLLSLD